MTANARVGRHSDGDYWLHVRPYNRRDSPGILHVMTQHVCL